VRGNAPDAGLCVCWSCRLEGTLSSPLPASWSQLSNLKVLWLLGMGFTGATCHIP